MRGELSDGEVVISTSGGQQALILNAVGDAVLELCDGTRTAEDIASFIRSTMTVPESADVLHDVRALLEELARAGVIDVLE